MKIGDYLEQDRISLDLKAHSKEEAVKEIAALLKSAEEIVDFDTFVKDVFDREKLGTTGIGNEIAIPHARTDAVKEFVIAFGRSSEGVEFNSLDGKPAKLIFLIGTQKEKNLNNYLKTLAHLTRLLKRESFRSLLLKASSPKEIIDEFKKVEGK
jgi:fructose-specific phosphotransferase system IIA component